MREIDLVIIGGGSAAMAAAVSARDAGVENLLILERQEELGGILNQCIHNGFGLHFYNEELTGPAYAARWVQEIKKRRIPYALKTHVLQVNREKVLLILSERGYEEIKAKAILFATGSHERTRGNLAIPGFRPAGVWTAGTAQRYVNLDGLAIGKKIVILGSGDIGLIMARRMSLEGVRVEGVYEINREAGGLPRNIQQCLLDFNIPLFLSHTVTNIHGKDRVEGVSVSPVDESFCPIEGKERFVPCDTLLLSVGLLPECQLLQDMGLSLQQETKSLSVNQSLETEEKGIFICGNALHIHDVVDFVSEEGSRAGKAAAEYLTGRVEKNRSLTTKAGDGLHYLLPSRIEREGEVVLAFRPKRRFDGATIEVLGDGKILRSLRKRRMIPAEMEQIHLTQEDIRGISKELEVRVIP